MIINNPRHLHERINNRRANTAESSLHEFLAYKFCFWCFDWHLACISISMSHWQMVHKAPAVIAKGTKLTLNLKNKPCLRSKISLVNEISLPSLTTKINAISCYQFLKPVLCNQKYMWKETTNMFIISRGNRNYTESSYRPCDKLGILTRAYGKYLSQRKYINF